jgi:hypothetical protein
VTGESTTSQPTPPLTAAGLPPQVQQYHDAVARACGDLAPGDRARLLSGLDEHLAELSAEGLDLVDELGDPAGYARELRLAADLPPAPVGPLPGPPVGPVTAVGPAAPAPGRSGRPWLVAAVLVAGTLLAIVVLVVAGLAFLVGGSSPEPMPVPLPTPTERVTVPSPAPTGGVSITVPDVSGMTPDQAREALEAAGLVVQEVRSTDGATGGATGTATGEPRVLAQDPAAGTSAAPGSAVTVTVGPPS